MIEASVTETLVERVEAELERVLAVRPALSSRIASSEAGAVYVVRPGDWSCSCPDAHRRGKGCKHALACWALWRVGGTRRRTFVQAHETFEDLAEDLAGRSQTGQDGVAECSGCDRGHVYDGQAGAWVAHEHCSGTGQARAFIYAKVPAGGRQLRECEDCRERYAGYDLVMVREDHESLSWFAGDELCEQCACRHGIV